MIKSSSGGGDEEDELLVFTHAGVSPKLRTTPQHDTGGRVTRPSHWHRMMLTRVEARARTQ